MIVLVIGVACLLIASVVSADVILNLSWVVTCNFSQVIDVHCSAYIRFEI